MNAQALRIAPLAARRARSGLLALGVATVLCCLSARPAKACQSTTCSVKNRPATCERDLSTTCWTSGVPVRWAKPCVSFSVALQGAPSIGLDYASAVALVASSFSVWTDATCGTGKPSVFAASLGPVVCQDVEFNPEGPNANVVAFRSSDWPYDGQVLGLTSVTFAVSTGEIRDADMEINLTHPSADREALSYILAHEAGHFLGLDHSADPTALMFSRYTPLSAVAPTLGFDDASSICASYDPSRPVTECDFAPATGFAPECGGDVEGGCAFSAPQSRGAAWLCGGLLLLVALSRRHRAHGTAGRM